MEQATMVVVAIALIIAYARAWAAHKRYQRLQDAVFEVYYFGHWVLIDPKKEVDEEHVRRVWTNLRDAAGFTPGDTGNR